MDKSTHCSHAAGWQLTQFPVANLAVQRHLSKWIYGTCRPWLSILQLLLDLIVLVWHVRLLSKCILKFQHPFGDTVYLITRSTSWYAPRLLRQRDSGQHKHTTTASVGSKRFVMWNLDWPAMVWTALDQSFSARNYHNPAYNCKHLHPL